MWVCCTRNLVGANLDELANFSFPSSIKSLNLSGNPINRIAGVIFPASLTQLAIKVGYSASTQGPLMSATSVAGTGVGGAGASPSLVVASSALELDEFEVRRTDADRFKTLQLFDVSKTSAVKCSDPLAKYFYVNNTMLCVLSDDDFVAKYARVVSTASSSDGDVDVVVPTNKPTARPTPRPLLHETWHQSRSWFLAASAAGLSAFVVAVAVGACLRASASRAARAFGARMSQSELARSKAAFDPDNSGPPMSEKEVVEVNDDESERLLAAHSEEVDTVDDTDTSVSVSTSDSGSTGVFNNSVSDKLAAVALAPSSLTFVQTLPLTTGTTSPTVQASGFAYALAKLDNTLVAAKTLRVRRRNVKKRVGFAGAHASHSSSSMRDFLGEIHLHSTLSHANIVCFLGCVRGSWGDHGRRDDSDADSMTLVTEYMDKGSLEVVIQAQKALLRASHRELQRDDSMLVAPSTDAHVWSWRDDSASRKAKLAVVLDVARALVYLHASEPSLFHGNLSSRKVLLDGVWRVKLSDFSCSSALLRWSERKLSAVSTTTPTPPPSDADDADVRMDMTVWTAPEVIDGQQYTTKADMYSFGILLSYLDTYEFPVDLLSRVDSEVAILSTSNYNGVPVISSERAPAAVRVLAMQCLSFQPEDRPSAQEALNELLATQMDVETGVLGATTGTGTVDRRFIYF